ncbi:MAG: hypothetical protein OEW83_08320 [Acidimicrobiia bacterium]|nr:hypothetical protein [Acidimicrobiia bacterium]
MGTHTGSAPAAHVDEQRSGATDADATDLDSDTVDRGAVVRARHQIFGFTVLGALCCLAAVVFTRWDPQQDPGRWFWSTIGTLIGVVCLVKAQRAHGGAGADRDASPYYGMFAGVTSGALLLMVLSVDGWVLPGVFFVMAAVLAFMAWIEQSAIGMTAAVCVAVLSAGSGVAVLNDATAVGFGSVALGVMLLTAAIAMGFVEDPVS